MSVLFYPKYVLIIKEKFYKKLVLILASSSPSRLKLMQTLGIPFEVKSPCIDESPLPQEKPVWYVKRISAEKARQIAQDQPEKPILAADTIVAVGSRILRKAQDEKEVYHQMQLLSGRRHRVYTNVCLLMPNGQHYQHLSVTHVAFKVLEVCEIQAFIQSQEWKNVAVYRYEGFVGRFIKMMRGAPSGVQGFPLFAVYQLLRGQGLWVNPALDHSLVCG